MTFMTPPRGAEKIWSLRDGQMTHQGYTYFVPGTICACHSAPKKGLRYTQKGQAQTRQIRHRPGKVDTDQAQAFTPVVPDLCLLATQKRKKTSLSHFCPPAQAGIRAFKAFSALCALQTAHCNSLCVAIAVCVHSCVPSTHAAPTAWWWNVGHAAASRRQPRREGCVVVSPPAWRSSCSISVRALQQAAASFAHASCAAGAASFSPRIHGRSADSAQISA